MSDFGKSGTISIPNELTKNNLSYEQQIVAELSLIRDALTKFAESQLDPFSDSFGIGGGLNRKPGGKKPSGKGFDSKNTNKFLEGIKAKIEEGMEAARTGLDKTYKEGVKSLIGPMNLIVSPLEDLTGKKFTDWLNPFSEKNKFKGNLNRNKIKEIDPGIVWFWDQQEKATNEKTKGSKIDEFLKKFGWTGGLGSLLKMAGIGAGIAMLAGGLIWATIDAIMGVLKAKSWGVSKFAGGMGGFIAGTGSGWSNAFKNAGKWALVGAGTGMLAAGPIGALAGGIIGGAIGLVLGWIGGEIVAKNVDRVGKQFSTLWKDKQKNLFEKLTGSVNIGLQAYIDGLIGFASAIPAMIYNIWEKDPKKIKGVKEGIDQFLHGIAALTPFNFIKHQFLGLQKAVGKFRETKDTKPFFTRLSILSLDLITNNIKAMWGMIKDFGNIKVIKDKFIPWIKDFAPKIWGEIQKGLGGAIEGLGDKLKTGVDFVGDLLKTISKAIGNFFISGFNKLKKNPFIKFVEDVAKGFGEFFKPVVRFFEYGAAQVSEKGIIKGLASFVGDMVTGGKDFTQFNQVKDVNESFAMAKNEKDNSDLNRVVTDITDKLKDKNLDKKYKDDLIETLKMVRAEIEKNKVQVNNNFQTPTNQGDKLRKMY